ncbi:MAG: DIP1984 family protein [Armatimonadota bacterium]
MKLAEALILRADTQKRIVQLKQRLLRNARIQEGDTPAEDPQALLTQMEEAAAHLIDLIRRINLTNTQSCLNTGQTLTDALAERDVLKLRQNVYLELGEAATVSQGRYSSSEVKYISTVSVKQVQQTADELAKRYRELDAQIQEANWRIDLAE